jgi:hypothetical protein
VTTEIGVYLHNLHNLHNELEQLNKKGPTGIDFDKSQALHAERKKSKFKKDEIGNDLATAKKHPK